jgi:hypothetical protein
MGSTHVQSVAPHHSTSLARRLVVPILVALLATALCRTSPSRGSRELRRGTDTPPATPEESITLASGRSCEAAVTVSLITIGPGLAIWERFGHNALWIHDPCLATDFAYDYGIFDFSESDFLPRFLRGRMRYSVERVEARDLLARYTAESRSMWIQDLRLTTGEAISLQQFLEWNVRPENRFYRYDYYLDNCSTRIRDALDRVLGGEVRRALGGIQTGETFRTETRRFVADGVLLDTGLLLALGEPADRPLSAWDAAFIPTELQRWLRTVTVSGPGRTPLPLVSAERVLSLAKADASFPGAARRILWYLVAGLVFGATIVALGIEVARSGSLVARCALALLGIVWALLSGLAGTILVGLWAVTDHVASYGNQNVLQVSPLALGVAVLMPAALWQRDRIAGWAVRLAIVLAGASLVGVLIRMLPGLHQANGEIIVLALPAHAGLASALLCIQGERRPTSGSVEHAFSEALEQHSLMEPRR